MYASMTDSNSMNVSANTTNTFTCICGETTNDVVNIDTCRYCEQTFLTTHGVCFDKHLQEHISRGSSGMKYTAVCQECSECKSIIYSCLAKCREKECGVVLHEQCVPYHLLHVHVNSSELLRVRTEKHLKGNAEDIEELSVRIEELEKRMDLLYDVFGYEIWEHSQK